MRVLGETAKPKFCPRPEPDNNCGTAEDIHREAQFADHAMGGVSPAIEPKRNAQPEALDLGHQTADKKALPRLASSRNRRNQRQAR